MPGVGLTFRRKDTERDYARWTIQSGLQRSDSEFLCVCMGVAIACCIRWVLIPQSGHKLPVAVVASAVILQAAMAWRRMSLEALTARRTAMVLGMRVFLQITTWEVNRHGLSIPMTNFLTIAIVSGLLTSFLTAFCLRLTFRQHFPYQIAASFAFLFLAAKGRCTHMMATPGASLVVSVAGRLDHWAKSIMTAMYGRCSNEPLICPCLHVMVWMQMFVILVVGSYFLWKLEWYSRRAFIQTLPEQRRREEALRIGFEDTITIKFIHAFLLVFAFAVTWELNYFLVDAINSCGA